MASIAKNGENWRVQIAIKDVRDSKIFSTKADAFAWSTEAGTEIRQQKNAGLVAGKTYGDIFNRCEKGGIKNEVRT